MSRAVFAAGCLVFLLGCRTTAEAPDLAGLYNRAASYHGADRNPIIVIPGILGSRLVDAPTGRTVWGAFSGDYANPQKPDGARLLALPMEEGVPLGDLRDEVAPKGVLDRIKVRVFGVPVEQKAYLNILGTLGVGGYRDEDLGLSGAIDYGNDHYTCFQFSYDWRRDNVENAKRLHAFILEKRAYVQKEIEKRHGVKNADVKFDIIAHSMGGLVTRYYLMYGTQDLPEKGVPKISWAGSRYVERAILLGTPNAGSTEAIIQLVQGVKFAPILPRYEPAVLGTMPSIYELLPRARHGALVDASDPGRKLDVLDPDLWERMGWGLADPAQDGVLRKLLPEVPDAAARRRIALDQQRKSLRRAGRFFEAIDRPASPPDGLTLHLIAGDAVQTTQVIAADSATGEIEVIARGPGDGTVLRSSALMDERAGGNWQSALRSPIDWRSALFLFTDHLALTRDPAFTDNILYLLLEEPRR
ncbi:MAG: hypothetical protein Q8R92_11300 [Deltaproteobacteria bacterium]|nr:hypothetical protein [Deltaproteobacteria bacterium]